MPNSRYNQYDGSTDSQSSEEIEVTFTPHCTIRANLARAFGTQSQFGQSLGHAMNDVHVVDGALYVDADKDKYKLFSWGDVAGLSPVERLKRDQEPSLEHAPLVESKTYGTTDKTYELVAARLESISEDDGEVLVESKSKRRDATFEGGEWSFGEWEDLGGDAVPIGDTLTWWEANEEYGPTTSSQRVAQLLTHHGEDAVVDDDDWMNWLQDVSGNNILRDDLDGREVEFWIDVRSSGNGRNYHYPILVDADTGAQIGPNNTAAGGSGNEESPSDGGESETIEMARELDSGSHPEPIADYIQSGEKISLTEDRAMNLIDELIEEPENGMTEEMVEEAGGRDALVKRVTE